MIERYDGPMCAHGFFGGITDVPIGRLIHTHKTTIGERGDYAAIVIGHHDEMWVVLVNGKFANLFGFYNNYASEQVGLTKLFDLKPGDVVAIKRVENVIEHLDYSGNVAGVEIVEL